VTYRWWRWGRYLIVRKPAGENGDVIGTGLEVGIRIVDINTFDQLHGTRAFRLRRPDTIRTSRHRRPLLSQKVGKNADSRLP
jgi:hypothetical protein